MGASSWVHVRVDAVLRVTERAALLDVNGEEVWVPLSQVADAADLSAGPGERTVSVTEWVAREKGLEGEG